jgi:type IV secretion system protein VirB11
MDNASAAETNLRWLLRPIDGLLTDPAMTDLYINGPGEGQCFVERGRGVEKITLPYTFDDLEDLAINAAALTRQDIAEDVPLVSTRFPDGHRVQIVRPPAIADNQFAFSIRQPRRETWTPSDLRENGVFASAAGRHRSPPPRRERLLSLYQAEAWEAFLELAVAARLNIVFSGTVGSGKTHNLRAFTHAIPRGWRLVTIEDMPELVGLPHENVVNLFYSKGGQSIANVRAEDLVEAALRMGMDGLLCQELRDEAAYAYLNVLESGHWGMTTTHADSAGQARDRIRGLIKKHPAGRHLSDADVMASLHRSIDVVVHCVRDGDRRYVEQVLYDPELKERTVGSGIPLHIAAE